MLEKITQYMNIKPPSQDDQTMQDIVKKTKSKDNSTDAQREEAFNLLVEDKIAEERNMQQLRKKSKRNDDAIVLMVPTFIHQPRITTANNLLKIGKNKTNRCSKCGNIMDAEDSVEVSRDKRSTFVCSKCMNREIVDFLNYNYL